MSTDDTTTPDLMSLDAIEDAMRAQLVAATDALNVKRREIRAYEDAVKRLAGSLAKLTGERPENTPGPKPTSKSDKVARWQPKPATLDKVFAVFEQDPGAKLKLSEVASRAGVAGETARAAVRVLREQERIRQAGASKGKTGQTSPVFALMGSNGSA